MSDFKKGLLLGFGIMIACVSFVASSSNNDVGRYTVYEGGYMCDTKTGTLYKMNDNVDMTYWLEYKIVRNKRN